MRQVWSIAVNTALGAAFCVNAQAQGSRVAGDVPSAEATTTGVLMVSGEKAVLGGASSVTALDRTAHVHLDRGGELLVCSTSSVHLTSAPSAKGKGSDDPLLVSLDRGALELRMRLGGADAVMTPDLRFAAAENKNGKPEPLDLSLRVTPDGDTCVDNRGRKSSLTVSDVFGEGAYLLKPGQHVLFVHGSLKSVVDREQDPCGCPQATPGVSIADAAVRGGGAGKEKAKADPYPFPTAQSEGLAPPAPVPAETPGQTHVQVASTLTYDPASEPKPASAPDEGSTTAPEPANPTTPPTPPQPAKGGVFHSIGSFFHRIFSH